MLSKSLAGGHWSGLPWWPGPCISRKEQCFLQSHIQSRIWKPPRRNPRAARSEASAPLPEVRHPAAPKRMERGWGAEECLTQSPQSPPRECEECGREELTRRRRDAEGLESAFAQKDKKETKGRLECGRTVNIENHGNRFADNEKERNKMDKSGGTKRPDKMSPAVSPAAFLRFWKTRGEETTWTTQDNFFMDAGRTTPPGERERIPPHLSLCSTALTRRLGRTATRHSSGPTIPTFPTLPPHTPVLPPDSAQM